MSWSVTIENLKEFPGFTPEIMQRFMRDNILYGTDAQIALNAAKAAGMSSCTLAGGRTPNPYGPDEIVTLTITGFARSVDFNTAMKNIVTRGAE